MIYRKRLIPNLLKMLPTLAALQLRIEGFCLFLTVIDALHYSKGGKKDSHECLEGRYFGYLVDLERTLSSAAMSKANHFPMKQGNTPQHLGDKNGMVGREPEKYVEFYGGLSLEVDYSNVLAEQQQVQ
jgi:hypothetical protein